MNLQIIPIREIRSSSGISEERRNVQAFLLDTALYSAAVVHASCALRAASLLGRALIALVVVGRHLRAALGIALARILVIE